MPRANVHIVVQGLVQGVGFRWFVAGRAQELGVHGYVRNLFNGNVEISAAGEQGALEELIRIVRVGPRSARVTHVSVDWDAPDLRADDDKHFEIR
jgi:acylphosphatase